MATGGTTEQTVLVAAIDFGTTYTGYAFSLRTNKGKIMMNKAWSDESGGSVRQEGVKTPSSILVDKNSKFLAFGVDAERRYSSYDPDQEDCFLFRHFKMQLHNIETLTRRLMVKSADDRVAMTAMDLIVMSLKHMKQCLLRDVNKTGKPSLTDEEIRWVVTVPAIWSDVSRSFMRQAALQAGLISNRNSKQLVLALEPEAAAIFIRSLDAKNFAVQADSVDQSTMEPGTKYMVVDIGGGTADIAVHRVNQSYRAEELCAPSGGDWGGLNINKGFEHLFAQVLGQDFVDACKKENRGAWFELMQEVENKKRNFNGEKSIRLTLSVGISQLYEKLKRGSIDDAFARAKAEGKDIELRSGFMVFKKEAIKRIFDNCSERIIGHLENLFGQANVRDVDHIMLVGGFVESPYLRNAICENFNAAGKNILTPQEASLAVVKGAVLYGYDPKLIASRCAARTYGTGTHVVFDEQVHKQTKKINVEGRILCKDVFKAIVTNNESVKVDEVRTFEFIPLESNSTDVSFEWYTCNRPDVKYIDDADVTHLQTEAIKLPITKTQARDIVVKMEVKFGDTEIFIRTVNMSNPTARPVDTVLTFEVQDLS